MTKSSACASIAMFPSLLKEGFVNVEQVVIGPHLRRAGIVIVDERARVLDFVGSTATGAVIHHIGARRLWIGLPLGALRLHS